MDTDLPSLGTMILVELVVVGITALATWRFAVFHFRRRRRDVAAQPRTDARMAQLEEIVDGVAREVEQLGESQDFVQELLAKRLAQMPPRLGEMVPRPIEDLSHGKPA